jgi:hypothetical protein
VFKPDVDLVVINHDQELNEQSFPPVTPTDAKPGSVQEPLPSAGAYKTRTRTRDTSSCGLVH